jgi:hypothetical protein
MVVASYRAKRLPGEFVPEVSDTDRRVQDAGFWPGKFEQIDSA